MDWSNERFIRLYTRDTVTWKLLDWRARTVLMHMFRKVDRAGVLDVGDDGVCGLAAIVELPLEIVEPGIAQLVARRGKAEPTVLETPNAYVIPRFLEAQETPQSDRRRQEESRARRRDKAMAESKVPTEPSRNVTDHSESVTCDVTRGHAPSHGVTPSDPSDPSEDLPSARDPTAPAPARSVLATPAVVDRDAEPQNVIHAPRPLGEAPMIWRELEQARAEAGVDLGLKILPLPLGDRGERDLADLFKAARERGPTEIAKLVVQCRHAIAMAKAETVSGEKSPEWFTGAVFGGDNFRRLVAKVAGARAGPRGRGPHDPPSERPNRMKPM